MFDAAIEKVTAAQQASDEKVLGIAEKRLKVEEQRMGQRQTTLAFMSGLMPQYSQPFPCPHPVALKIKINAIQAKTRNVHHETIYSLH